MPIEFRCPACQQQLRVPDESAGKNAKCPKCGTIAVIPSANFETASPPPFPPLPPPPPSQPPPPPPSSFPFGDAQSPGGRNPFADQTPPPPSLNPYASPAAAYQPTALELPSGAVGNQRVEVGHIWNYAWQVWQSNLGLLVGMTLLVAVITGPLRAVVRYLERNDPRNELALLALAGSILVMVLNIYLGIGQAQIALKLARRQPASISDLFGGARRFFPVLGLVILLGFAVTAGLFLCIVPGVLLLIMFWPSYYLVIDERATLFETFALAYNITEGNRVTTFLLWLLSVAVIILGLLAACVGVLFAAPLVAMVWATAYLMMSGQIPTTPGVSAIPGMKQDAFAKSTIW
jgi:hypothetical protein